MGRVYMQIYIYIYIYMSIDKLNHSDPQRQRNTAIALTIEALTMQNSMYPISEYLSITVSHNNCYHLYIANLKSIKQQTVTVMK